MEFGFRVHRIQNGLPRTISEVLIQKSDNKLSAEDLKVQLNMSCSRKNQKLQQNGGLPTVAGGNVPSKKESGRVPELRYLAERAMRRSKFGVKEYFTQEMHTRLGRHEMAVCYESDPVTLWNAYIRCRKNPGHSEFIPLSQFGAGHLPVSCRDPRIVAYIRALSRFTVRIVSKYTSVHRPREFPCANLRGTEKARLASGFAWVPGDIQRIECTTPNCRHGNQSHSVYGPIRILTNKHVVFDQSEAVKTVAQFHFDNPYQTRGLGNARCSKLDYSLLDSDVAHLQCYTHDPHLCDLLVDDMDYLRAIYRDIPLAVWENCEELSVVISHPHGMAKTVSVGFHQQFNQTAACAHAHYYSSATCPGSSGAPVFYVCRQEKGAHPMWIPAVHSFHSHALGLNVGFK